MDLAELIISQDEGSAFDQPCHWGNRVGNLSVYCHNKKWLGAPRKCRCTWYTGGEVRDEDCQGYKANNRRIK